MNQYFSFRFTEPENPPRPSLVIFYEKKISLDTISRVIKDDVTENLAPKHIYLVTFKGAQYPLGEIQKNINFCEEVTSYINEDKIENCLSLLEVSPAGKLLETDSNFAGLLLHHGMLELFKKHRGLIVSNNSYHFVKPSGKHCNSFIRASNLLVSSNEVSFLAISLLPFLTSQIKRIYIDTSSIAFLVSIAINLSGRYRNKRPSIDSFESYAALNEPYDFIEDDDSLVIISATTSGSLAEKLITDKKFSCKKVITLFHLGLLPSKQIGLFKIDEVVESNKPVSFDAENCDLCKLESRMIHISGEQFLPENPKNELLLVRKANFKKSRALFFEKLVATGALEWNKNISTNASHNEHFYINIELALEAYKDELGYKGYSFTKTLKRYFTKDITDIISLDDKGSLEFANWVDIKLNTIFSKLNIKQHSYKNIKDLALSKCGSVMVVAGAITSGRQLLSVSRDLRGLNPDSSIIYIVAFSKIVSEQAQEQIRKDLEQGGHTFIVLETCALPRIKEYTKTAWQWEQEALLKHSENDPLADSTILNLPTKLQKRLDYLNNGKYLADSLFLPSPIGKKLSLRETFAFWADFNFDNNRLSSSTQSDVYWTIQAVLHDLLSDTENASLATPYHTTLLSPVNFDRFNDGIIQACFLRAASPINLDYSSDEQYSRKMADIIISIIRNWSNNQGEAALEFLMAILTRRLRLYGTHIKEIKEKSEEIGPLPEEMKFLLSCLE